jgi:hypothetical protein
LTTGFVLVIAARAAITEDILADSSATVSSNESCFSLVAEIGTLSAGRVRYGNIAAEEVARRGCEGADVRAVRSLLKGDKSSSIKVIPFDEGSGRTFKVEKVL